MRWLVLLSDPAEFGLNLRADCEGVVDACSLDEEEASKRPWNIDC